MKKSKIFLVLQNYAPNTAATNRFMGLIKAFSQQNINTEVVFLSSAIKNPKLPDFPHVNYHLLSKYIYSTNSKIQNLLYLTLYKFLLRIKIHKGDRVYLYSCNEYIPYLVKCKDIKIFHERTEHPEVSKMKVLNLKKYLKACSELDGLFVISTGLKKFFVSSGVPIHNIHIINMTADINRFNNITSKTTERYIAYCGKATNNKDGVDQLLKAFSIVVRSYPDVKLHIIGTPPNKTEISSTIKLIEELGITENVVLRGVIPSEQIPQVLKNAEILTLARPATKQAQYGFPTKLGEYLLTKKPVVITDTGDIPIFLKDFESALLCKPDDIEEFAERIKWLLEHRKEAEIIGTNGYKVAVMNFNSEIEAMKIYRVMTK